VRLECEVEVACFESALIFQFTQSSWCCHKFDTFSVHDALMKQKILTLALATISTAAFAQFNLANYSLSSTVTYGGLPYNDELSGVTYNGDNGRLYVVEDEAQAVYEFDKTGAHLSTMTITGGAGTDTEGVTYIGGGQFLMAEERTQNIYRFSYTAGGSFARAGLPAFNVGPLTNNTGLEGISYDPISGTVFGLKEKSPQLVYTVSGLDLASMTGGSVSAFVPSLGTLDLSDVQVLSTVPSLFGTGDQNNLLVLSQESDLLLEIDQAGNILSQLDLSSLGSDSIEGVTIDEYGTIYLVSEDPKMFIFNVPEPSTAALIALGGALVAVRRRRVQA